MQDRKKSESISGWLQVISFLAVYLVVFIALGYFMSPALKPGLVSTVIVALTTAAILSIGLVAVFSKLIFGRDVTVLGLALTGNRRQAIAGAFLGIFLITFGSLILYAGGWLVWINSSSALTDIVLVSGVILLSAFSEELVFRGFILGRLLTCSNRYIALFTSSAIFSIFHINNPDVSAVAVINIFLGGVLLGINYTYTKNIWFGFMLHFTWNLLQGPVLGISVSGLMLPSMVVSETHGPPLLTGGNFGLEGSIVQGLLMVGGILTIWRLNEQLNNAAVSAKKI